MVARRVSSASAALARAGVAAGAQGVQARDLVALDLGIDAQGGDGRLIFGGDEVVDADDDLLFVLDGALVLVGGLLDFALDEAAFDGAQHSAQGVNFLDVFPRAGFDFVGEALDGVGAGDGIHRYW